MACRSKQCLGSNNALDAPAPGTDSEDYEHLEILWSLFGLRLWVYCQLDVDSKINYSDIVTS